MALCAFTIAGLLAAACARDIPRQTPTQVAMMAHWQREAEGLSAAATPALLAHLESSDFRSVLAECCPVAAAVPVPDLLTALRAELRGAELVHNFQVVSSNASDVHHAVEDTNLEFELNARAFYNIWEVAFLTKSFDVISATSRTEVDMFGFQPFTGGNMTDPGSQPRSFEEAQERPIYTALNARAVNSGNPNFGPVSAVFRPAYVQNMTFVAPLDTGIWEMVCNASNPGTHGTSRGSGAASRRELALGRLAAAPQDILNCSAWGGHGMGTLEHLDHLILASEKLWNNASTLLETLNRLFETVETVEPATSPSSSSSSSTLASSTPAVSAGAALPLTMLQAFHYFEANLAGNVLLPDGIKHVLGSARLLGSAAASMLRDWCVLNNWALLWSAGPVCSTPKTPALCYGPNASSFGTFVGQERVLDPLVAARLGNCSNTNSTPGCHRGEYSYPLNVVLPLGTAGAFRAAEDAHFRKTLNATDREETVMTPAVQRGWESLIGAMPAAAKLRALRAADGCDLDWCVGAAVAAPIGKVSHCVCYEQHRA
jgi:hypothetical protein